MRLHVRPLPFMPGIDINYSLARPHSKALTLNPIDPNRSMVRKDFHLIHSGFGESEIKYILWKWTGNFLLVIIIITLIIIEANRGTRTQACDCTRDRLWLRFPVEELKYFHFLHSGIVAERDVEFSFTQHVMAQELGGKWRAECLNSRFSLTTLKFVWQQKINIHFIFFAAIRICDSIWLFLLF